MKKLSLSILLLTIVISFSNAQQTTLIVEINGLGNDTVFIVHNILSRNNSFEDYVLAQNNKFTYQTIINKPTLIYLKPKKALSLLYSANNMLFVPSSKRISLVLLPNDTTVVKGILDKYSLKYSVNGDDINKDLCRLHMRNLKREIEYNKLILEIDSLEQSGSDWQNNEPMQKLLKIKTDKRKERIQFIENNPDKDLTVLKLVSSNNPEIFGQYFNTLEPKVRNGIFKDILQERIDWYNKYLITKKKREIVVAGTEAPDFTLKSINGDDFSLSSIKDRYIVLDFWGSWCMPCLEGLPKMKEYYKKYSDKIEFIGIACNDTEDKWKKSVEQNQLPWVQVINKTEIDLDVSVKYGIQGYPTKVLIDSERKIVQIFRGESDYFYRRLDEIFLINNN